MIYWFWNANVSNAKQSTNKQIKQTEEIDSALDITKFSLATTAATARAKTLERSQLGQ